MMVTLVTEGKARDDDPGSAADRASAGHRRRRRLHRADRGRCDGACQRLRVVDGRLQVVESAVRRRSSRLQGAWKRLREASRRVAIGELRRIRLSAVRRRLRLSSASADVSVDCAVSVSPLHFFQLLGGELGLVLARWVGWSAARWAATSNVKRSE